MFRLFSHVRSRLEIGISPLVSTRPLRIDNSVSEARDLLAGERNYLTTLRSTLTVILATASILITPKRVGWTEWTLSGLLWGVAVLLPILALFNYGVQLDHYQSPGYRRFHNSKEVLVILAFMLILGILVSVDAFYFPQKTL